MLILSFSRRVVLGLFSGRDPVMITRWSRDGRVLTSKEPREGQVIRPKEPQMNQKVKNISKKYNNICICAQKVVSLQRNLVIITIDIANNIEIICI